MTKGHSSHIGCGFVIELDTGIVVDYEVLCNHCNACEAQKKKKKNDAEFQEWYTAHKSSGKCQKNFEGKAGEMEKRIAVLLWQRSCDLGFRYVTFLGDGDTASYKAVCDLNDGRGPYETVTVEKEECLNHVAKRVSTRLKKLKKDKVTPQVTKTGKTRNISDLDGKNMLTDKVIKKCQSYFCKAVVENIHKEPREIKKDVLATYMHGISTDDEPKHKMCPDGSSSWCFYKQAKAVGQDPKLLKYKPGDLSMIPAEKRKDTVYYLYTLI